MRALFVLLALALLPGVALAHGDHSYSSAQEKPTETAAAIPWTPARDAVSPACPTPVHACGCGNLSLCDAGSKPPAVLAEAGPVLSVGNNRDAVLFQAAAPRAFSKRTPHHPRAPPSRS